MIDKKTTKGLEAGSEQWMELRSTSTGGSEASTITGMNPFQSAFALWCEKTGRAKPFAGNLATELGQWTEEFVAKKFSEKTGYRVQRSNFIYFNDKYPSQHALPDRLVFPNDDLADYQCGLEIKTTSAFHRMKDGQFPESYYCQCVQYLSVMEYDVWFLAVLVGNSEFHIFEMRRSDDIPVPEWVEGVITVDESEFIALRDACNEFMRMVREDIPPIADGSESSTESLNDIYPVAEEGTEKEIDCEQTIRDYLRISAEIKDLEKEKDALANILKQEVAENETGICGDYRVTWKNSSRTTFDSKRFKADSPDLYERYSKVSTTRTLNVKGDKK